MILGPPILFRAAIRPVGLDAARNLDKAKNLERAQRDK
jgi:hypothetical protein